MTLKNLLILGGAVAGAAYLKDKNRRDRFMGQARGFIDQVKSRATDLANDVKSRASDTLDAAGSSSGASTGASTGSGFSSPSSSFGSSGYGNSRTY